MTRVQLQPAFEIPFRLASITETTPPDGSEGIWHRYVIAQGANTITGMRSGTRVEISLQLENMVERLNERFGKKFKQ